MHKLFLNDTLEMFSIAAYLSSAEPIAKNDHDDQLLVYLHITFLLIGIANIFAQGDEYSLISMQSLPLLL